MRVDSDISLKDSYQYFIIYFYIFTYYYIVFLTEFFAFDNQLNIKRNKKLKFLSFPHFVQKELKLEKLINKMSRSEK